MAKSKAPLTPEQAEVKAMKKEKNSQNFIKFLAIVLAFALTFGVVSLGKSTAEEALAAAGSNVQSGDVSTDTPDDTTGDVSTDTPSDDMTAGDDTTVEGEDATTGDDATAGEDATTGDNATDAPAGDNAGAATFSKANAHEMLNKWTAAAAKKSYKWNRVCAYTPDGAINVGSATNILNNVIKGIDENASLDTVVGGFLGIGNRNGEVKNGVIPEEMNAQYALKAMSLTAADVKSATANGNKFVVTLGNFANPQKDGKNAMSRATNDFFTHQEVVDGIAGITTAIKVDSTDVQYTNVTLTAVVDGDNLKSLEINYGFSAKMVLKVGVSITGTGKATNKIVYTIL